MPSNIPITETWERSNWAYWTTTLLQTGADTLGQEPTNTYAFSVNGQSHIDVTGFTESGWTNLTSGSLPDTHFPGGWITASHGNNVSELDLTDGAYLDFANVPDGSLVLTLPDFPLSDINRGETWVDLSSDGFDQQILSLSLLESQNTLVNGNTYALWTPTQINATSANLRAITGIRIRVAATQDCTVYLAGLRLVGPEWVVSNVDFDSANEVLRKALPLDADPDYVVPENQVLPVLYRSDDPTSLADPTPINGTIVTGIFTGDMEQANQFTLYMRQQNVEYITQANLEGIIQVRLDGQDVQNLGVSEPLQIDNWQAFQYDWGSDGCSVSIFGSAYQNTPYTYTFDLEPSTQYWLLSSLHENVARAQIYAVSEDGLTGDLVFDTTDINDAFAFVRQPGRIGFQASLNDNNTYIQSIRPSEMVFAAFQSLPMTSDTPVSAARLYADFSPDTPLWQSWFALPDGNEVYPILATDAIRTTTGESVSVTINSPTLINRDEGTLGVISNLLTPYDDGVSGITDFANFEISFQLWMPAGIVNDIDNLPILSAELVNGEGGAIPLNIPAITANSWQTIKLSLADGFYPSGLYTLRIHYNGSVPVKFWLDNVTISQRTIAWSARSIVSDPWNANYAPWTPFKGLVNSDTQGVRFTNIGNQLQIQAEALQQNGAIYGNIQTIPVYAQLGNLLFPDDPARQPTPNHGVYVSISTAQDGRTVTFSANAISPEYAVASFQWAFGDGSYGTGQTVAHTYANPTSYLVILTATDVTGTVGSATESVTIND